MLGNWTKLQLMAFVLVNEILCLRVAGQPTVSSGVQYVLEDAQGNKLRNLLPAEVQLRKLVKPKDRSWDEVFRQQGVKPSVQLYSQLLELNPKLESFRTSTSMVVPVPIDLPQETHVLVEHENPTRSRIGELLQQMDGFLVMQKSSEGRKRIQAITKSVRELLNSVALDHDSLADLQIIVEKAVSSLENDGTALLPSADVGYVEFLHKSGLTNKGPESDYINRFPQVRVLVQVVDDKTSKPVPGILVAYASSISFRHKSWEELTRNPSTMTSGNERPLPERDYYFWCVNASRSTAVGPYTVRSDPRDNPFPVSLRRR